MKVYQIENAFGLENLKLVDRPEPKPGHGQVLVKLKAFSLNFRDLMVAKGTYNPRMKLPRVPVSDGAGEVVEVGPGVERVKAGDRVASLFMQKWIEGDPTPEKGRSALGGALDGVLSEYALLDGEGVVPFPEHLSYEEAATLPCAAVTAWHALISEGNTKPGDVVLVQGTGGVSIFALQFARLAGARVIATSSSDAKLQRVVELGASATINYKQTPDWAAKAIELTGGPGADHIVEVGGSGTLNQSLKTIRLDGRISLIGALAGGSGDIMTVSILMKNVRVQGIFVGSRVMFEAMNRAIALHRLKPVIDRVFPFSEALEAFRYMESAGHFGKICISL